MATDQATLQGRLDEAEQAYHDIAIGKGVARLRDSNGEEVQYNMASLPKLQQYIFTLKTQLGQACGGPMRPLIV